MCSCSRRRGRRAPSTSPTGSTRASCAGAGTWCVGQRESGCTQRLAGGTGVREDSSEDVFVGGLVGAFVEALRMSGTGYLTAAT